MQLKSFILKLVYLTFIIYTFFSFTTIAIAFEDYAWSTSSDTLQASSPEENTIENSSDNPLNLESGSAILIDQDSGQILYEHNIHEQLRPASVTKIMSILLVMEALDSGQIKLDDKVPCSEKASSMGGSQIWLTTTESLSVDEMLKCMCVVSANDYKVQLRHKKF